SKSPIAAFLASMSCFTLKSTRIKSLPFLVSKKWEAVQLHPPFFFEPKAEVQQQPSGNPAPETLPEGPKKYFQKVVARRTDFCVY
ncbi:hypothetical protein ACTQWD_08465, partial [Collinsella sp. LCP19S3_B6]|uniref:hypothetical protein n=1 Tax=Collinsella sp. LCP19S3_B6 TaxID=3438755 RepID=UPI003F8DD811